LPADKIIVVRNDECDENIKKAGGKAYDGSALFDGNFDHIQDVLTTLNIPHTLIGKSELDKDTYSLDDKWILIFNSNFFFEHCCNPEHLKLAPNLISRVDVCPGPNNHQVHSTKLSDKAIKKIRHFVEEGGYLFTEHMNIQEIIERAFKKVIVHTRFLRGKLVKIQPASGQEQNPYLKYVFNTPYGWDLKSVPSVQWKIDDESPNIRIINKDKVTVLIVSPELAMSQRVKAQWQSPSAFRQHQFRKIRAVIPQLMWRKAGFFIS